MSEWERRPTQVLIFSQVRRKVGVSWRGTVFAGSGLERHRTQVRHDDGVSLTLMRLKFLVVDLRCCQAAMRHVQWP